MWCNLTAAPADAQFLLESKRIEIKDGSAFPPHVHIMKIYTESKVNSQKAFPGFRVEVSTACMFGSLPVL